MCSSISARRCARSTREEARLIDDALDGLAEAMEGRDVDALFADLVGREPQLPEHLREGAK